MVPIYAVDSWFAIKFPSAAIYLDSARECYEAYVIYNFMAYIFNYLTREYELAGKLGSKPQVRHILPAAWCLPEWPMGGIFIQRCQQGVLQYTLIRPFTTLIAFVCELTGVYHEGEFNVSYAWLWMMIVNNLSQIWAMYCLMMFYIAAKEELQPIRPVGKFICVKLVVFASFWQGVVIAIIVALINIDIKWGWDTKEQLANGLQDLLICFEMFVASIAHHYTFSYKPYVNVHHNVPWYRSIKNMFDISDVRNDVTDQVKRAGDSVPWRLKNPKSFFASTSSKVQKKKKTSDHGGSPAPCDNNDDDEAMIASTQQQRGGGEVDERSALLSSTSSSSHHVYTTTDDDDDDHEQMANVLGYGSRHQRRYKLLSRTADTSERDTLLPPDDH